MVCIPLALELKGQRCDSESQFVSDFQGQWNYFQNYLQSEGRGWGLRKR